MTKIPNSTYLQSFIPKRSWIFAKKKIVVILTLWASATAVIIFVVVIENKKLIKELNFPISLAYFAFERFHYYKAITVLFLAIRWLFSRWHLESLLCGIFSSTAPLMKICTPFDSLLWKEFSFFVQVYNSTFKYDHQFARATEIHFFFVHTGRYFQ